MSTEAISEGGWPLFARTRDFLIRPGAAWARVASSPPASAFVGHVAPLALVGAGAGLAAHLVYRGAALDARLAWAAISAVLFIIFALAGVRIAQAVIGFLLHRYGAEPEQGRSAQLAAYSATPVLVASLGAVIPPLAASLLLIGAIYSLVILAQGVRTLAAPPDPEMRIPRLTLAFAGLWLVLTVLSTVVATPLQNSAFDGVRGIMETGGAGDPAQAIAGARRSGREVAIERLMRASGARTVADAAQMETQFPRTLPGGFELQSASHDGGAGFARASGVYTQDLRALTVTIVQMTADIDAAAAAAMLGSDDAVDGGYAREQSIDGRYYAERVGEGAARYVVIGRGVAMIAEGAVTIDDARAAVQTIGLQRLEAVLGR
ncbi:MAG: Yip1 family protein [Hyphomonadaceae bacterium]